jgi:hypothetical protein
MLGFVRGKVSERKLRLFACSCCRRIERFLNDAVVRKALNAAERYADGRIRDSTAHSWYRKAIAAHRSVPRSTDSIPEFHAYCAVAWSVLESGSTAYLSVPNEVAATLAAATAEPQTSPAWLRTFRAELAALSDLLRDIVGNPFRPPPAIDDGWLRWQGGMVGRMVSVIYEERRFDELPILADALEDAGCDNADILSHCRSGGEHARGCWLLDLLLNKP